MGSSPDTPGLRGPQPLHGPGALGSGPQLLPHSASLPASPLLQPLFLCLRQWLCSPDQTLDRRDDDDSQMPIQRCPRPLRPHGLHQKGSEQHSLTVTVMVTGTLTDEFSCLSCHADPWSCPLERGDLVIHPQKQVLHPKHPCLSLTKSGGVRGAPESVSGDQPQTPCGLWGSVHGQLPPDPPLSLSRLVILEEGSRENRSWTHLPVRKGQCLSFNRHLEGLETPKEPGGSHKNPQGVVRL